MIRKPRTEKNFTPEGGETIISNAACLNRIFKKVEIDGLSEDAANELAEDIKYISERFSVSPKAAVLLAAILEKCSNNGCDEEDLANYIGRGGTSFQEPVDYACENGYDGLLILTDGYAPEPVIPDNMRCKIIWVCEDRNCYERHHHWMEKSGRVCSIELK